LVKDEEKMVEGVSMIEDKQTEVEKVVVKKNVVRRYKYKLDFTGKTKKSKQRKSRDGQRTSWQKTLILSALDGKLKLLMQAAKWEDFDVNLEGLKNLGKVDGYEHLEKAHYFVFRKSRRAKKNQPEELTVSYDRTALHIALRKAAASPYYQGYSKVVRGLLQLGAKTSLKGRNGKTALALQEELLPHWPSLNRPEWRKPGFGIPSVKNKKKKRGGSRILRIQENQKSNRDEYMTFNQRQMLPPPWMFPIPYQQHMLRDRWIGQTFQQQQRAPHSHYLRE